MSKFYYQHTDVVFPADVFDSSEQTDIRLRPDYAAALQSVETAIRAGANTYRAIVDATGVDRYWLTLIVDDLEARQSITRTACGLITRFAMRGGE